jgi:hypothetical protein
MSAPQEMVGLAMSPETRDAIASAVDGAGKFVGGALTALCLALAARAGAESKPPVDGALVDINTLAVALGVSRATIGRAKRDPAFPRHRVGARERFSVEEVRAFLDARGPRRATEDNIDVSRVAAAGGLRVVGGRGR